MKMSRTLETLSAIRITLCLQAVYSVHSCILVCLAPIASPSKQTNNPHCTNKNNLLKPYTVLFGSGGS